MRSCSSPKPVSYLADVGVLYPERRSAPFSGGTPSRTISSSATSATSLRPRLHRERHHLSSSATKAKPFVSPCFIWQYPRRRQDRRLPQVSGLLHLPPRFARSTLPRTCWLLHQSCAGDGDVPRRFTTAALILSYPPPLHSQELAGLGGDAFHARSTAELAFSRALSPGWVRPYPSLAASLP